MSKLTNPDKQKDLQDKNDKDGKEHHSDIKDDFDDWKRLEKWQIGRRNFC